MADKPRRDEPVAREHPLTTADLPEEVRGEKFVTITVAENVDEEAVKALGPNPEARF